jgi:glycosyltransferase involved in cell wall biosynthesis
MQAVDFHQPSPIDDGKSGRDRAFDFSLVIPVYLNEENINDLLEAVFSLKEKLNGTLEIVFVVDGSPDRSYALLAEALPSYPIAAQLLALSRNFGSFAAIRVGLEAARGKYVAVMAADLQEPPDLVESFFNILQRDEADVVFGARKSREDLFF